MLRCERIQSASDWQQLFSAIVQLETVQFNTSIRHIPITFMSDYGEDSNSSSPASPQSTGSVTIWKVPDNKMCKSTLIVLSNLNIPRAIQMCHFSYTSHQAWLQLGTTQTTTPVFQIENFTTSGPNFHLLLICLNVSLSMTLPEWCNN